MFLPEHRDCLTISLLHLYFLLLAQLDEAEWVSEDVRKLIIYYDKLSRSTKVEQLFVVSSSLVISVVGYSTSVSPAPNSLHSLLSVYQAGITGFSILGFSLQFPYRVPSSLCVYIVVLF